MFTIFLTATAAVVSALLGGLLLRPSKQRRLGVPYGAAGVALAALALTVVGLQMV